MSSVPDTSNRVSVTFDEHLGPLTRPILKTFADYRMSGTFFSTGRDVRERPRLARAIVHDGHEIGNHSWNHEDLTQLPNGGAANLRRTDRAITRVTGYRPCTMRPPFLLYDSGVTAAAHGLNLRTILATRSNDWLLVDPTAICDYALDDVASGDIILMHQLETSATALPCIFSGLRDRGLVSVPVFHLLGGTVRTGRT